MLKDEEIQSDSRTCPMCGFTAEIQEMMYSAVSFADRVAMRKLLRYKARNNICSEEFLYLLAEAHVIVSDNKNAEKLIRELEESSEWGRAAAGELREALEYGEGIWDDEDANLPFGNRSLLQSIPYQQDWDDDWEPLQPFVRETPKIGRNDPCPCGSGKKYKKCCGRTK